MYAIYGYDECEWCRKAKELLEREHIDHTYQDVPLEDRKRFMDYHGFLGQQRTFPKIWRGDRLIGGYQELVIDIQNLDINMSDDTREEPWDDRYVGGVENFT